MPGRKRRNIHTLRAQWLGQTLRELRERNELTLKEAGEYLQRSLAAISRYELAEWPIRRGDVLALLDLYQVSDERERRRLIELAEDVWRTDEWDAEYGDLIDRTFIDLPWLESRANRICSYDAMNVPGLLQTRQYAEAVIRTAEGPEASPTLIERGVALRMERQKVLEGSSPTQMDAVVDEAVLRRPVGGHPVMRKQLDHLQSVARRRNVRVRIVPMAVGSHAGFDGSFQFFELPQPYPEVAYVESLGGRLYIEYPRSSRFVKAYSRIEQVALGQTESAARIAQIAEELDE